MKKSFLKYTLCASMLLALAACGGHSDGNAADSANGIPGEAAIEAAIIEGRTAARALINVNPADTFAIQQELLNARARQSKYVTAGKKIEAEAFDTAFMHTLYAVQPRIADAVAKIAR